MRKFIMAGLILCPVLAAAAIDPAAVRRDSAGKLDIRDGNYTCQYRSLEDDEHKDKNAGELALYIETTDSNGAIFIAQLPGGITLSSPILQKTASEKNHVNYMPHDSGEGFFMIESSTDKGLSAVVNAKDGAYAAAMIADDCRFIVAPGGSAETGD